MDNRQRLLVQFSFANALIAAAMVVATCCGAATSAQSIDLSLNIFYSVPTDESSGGTWEIVGKSSNSGIQGLGLFVTGVSPIGITNEAPRANINGDGPASGGFNEFLVDDNDDYVAILLAQTPLSPGQSEQPVFYGVGTLANGSPAFAGQVMGTNSIGPTFTTLTSPLDIPWGTGDALGEVAWDTAARLVSGTFAAGQTPAFYSSGPLSTYGSVFTSVGSLTSIGSTSNISATNVTTIVRDNLVEAFFADFNQDGIVDSADYTVWRDTLGDTVTPGTGADGNFSGEIDQADYDLWRQLFGTVTAPGSLLGSGGGVAVPEPGTKTLVIFTVLLVGATFFTARMGQIKPNFAGVEKTSKKTNRTGETA